MTEKSTNQAEQTKASLDFVKKRVFNLRSYTTQGGKVIRDVRIGYETYGKLNERGDNAILVAHFFSGTSHAAGRYSPSDKEVGYWDAIIGPGKAIDTDKYFVVSADTLANLNAKDTNTITTGPASINPDTGKPYGMAFPIVTIRDFVNVQKALVDELGITRLHAAVGPSMGSMQALEWAAAFPDFVERVLAVVPAGIEADPYLIASCSLWTMPIMFDPNWNDGNYYGKQEPTKGLVAAFNAITLNGRHYGWANTTFGRKPATDPKALLQDFQAKFLVEDMLERVSQARAATVDANSVLYTIKACQLYSLGHCGSSAEGVKNIKAKVLLMPAKSDLLMFPEYAKKAADALQAAGKHVEYAEIEGEGGHFDGLLAIAQGAQRIKEFIES